MERDIQIQAVVTASSAFGEMHRSVTLFSKQLGLIKAVVYGGRKGKKVSLAPLFSYGSFQLYHNPVKDEYSLIEEQSCFTAENIKSDLKATYTASYFCEVVNTINTDEPERTYELLKDALTTLDENIELQRKTIIDFTWQFLRISGLGADLRFCPGCDRKLDDNQILFFSSSMITPVCEDCSDTDSISLTPGARRYLIYTSTMSFEQAFKVELLEGATAKLSTFLLKWISVFSQYPLKTLKSNILL